MSQDEKVEMIIPIIKGDLENPATENSFFTVSVGCFLL